MRDHDGAVVKTIGDAVMASFGDPANAVKAALAMQARIADHELVLKLGIHVGPSVVVNLNDRLDYFGSTVNMAARLQGQSQGGDIVLSPRRRRRSRGAPAAGNACRARGKRAAERLRPADQLRPPDALVEQTAGLFLVTSPSWPPGPE